MAANYEQRAVLFLDVLGFKRLIKDKREDLIENALEITCAEQQSNYSASAFSDNIVMSIVPTLGYELLEMVHFASNLSLHLLHAGVLTRGGITFGEIHHKGSVVYGPALVRAYELESQVANYPRIIMDPKAIANSLQAGGAPDSEEYIRNLLRTDFDGQEHVHIMDHNANLPHHIMLSPEDTKPGFIRCKALIKAKADAVKKALECNPANDDRSRSKHEWLKRYTEEYKNIYNDPQHPISSGIQIFH